jgi:RimJ/RimL family protein N-acetyltransferase
MSMTSPKPTPTAPFATTERLLLRAYQDTDAERLWEFDTDPRVARTAAIDYIVPCSLAKSRDLSEKLAAESLLYAIIEVKPSTSTEGRDDADDEDRWVGHIMLRGLNQKNRDAMLGIAITPRFWDRVRSS